MVKNFVLVFIIVLINNKSSGQIDNSQNTKDSILVNNELNEFVESFKNLDFVNFQAFFADDVTVFFPPSSMTAQRINGKEKVLNTAITFSLPFILCAVIEDGGKKTVTSSAKKA